MYDKGERREQETRAGRSKTTKEEEKKTQKEYDEKRKETKKNNNNKQSKAKQNIDRSTIPRVHNIFVVILFFSSSS